MKHILSLLSFTIVASSFFSFSAMAAGGPVAKEPEVNRPSPRYSGSVPIDTRRGLFGANGTFGDPNPEIEKWSQAPMAAPNLSTLPYSYNERERFLAAIEKRMIFFEEAIANLKDKGSETKVEVLEHSQKAVAALEPALEQARKSLKSAKSAGESAWGQAESEARSAYLHLQGVYYGLNRH